jgi:hypothetical protein
MLIYTGLMRANCDTGTSLNYLNARYLNAAQGQFVAEDPVFVGVNPNQQKLEDPHDAFGQRVLQTGTTRPTCIRSTGTPGPHPPA